MQLHISK